MFELLIISFLALRCPYGYLTRHNLVDTILQAHAALIRELSITGKWTVSDQQVYFLGCFVGYHIAPSYVSTHCYIVCFTRRFMCFNMFAIRSFTRCLGVRKIPVLSVFIHVFAVGYLFACTCCCFLLASILIRVFFEFMPSHIRNEILSFGRLGDRIQWGQFIGRNEDNSTL